MAQKRRFKKPKSFNTYQEILRRQLDGTLYSEEDQQQDELIVNGRRIRISNRYEPKRKNRFMVTFPTEFNIPQHFVRWHTKPKLTRQGWSNIEITLMDPIGPSMTQRVMDYIRGGLWIHNVPFNLIIESLDPTGIVVERWSLENCEVIEFDFGENDYTSDDTSTIKLKIKPTDCILMF